MKTFMVMSFFSIGLATAGPLCTNTTDIAGGGLPNSGRPPVLSQAAVRDLQLLLFLENLEASYFSSGLSNITKWGIHGYPNDTIEIVGKIAAQEKVHVATIADLLEANNESPLSPCNYSFPVNSTTQFLEVAELITSIGIGAAIDLTERFAVTDPLLMKSISSILTVESRQDAFFRHIEGEVPKPAPFDTGISAIWAYNFALSFIMPGSCPVEVPLPALPTLNVSNLSCSGPTNSTMGESLREFTWDPTQMSFVTKAGKKLLVGWVNQLNLPIYTPLNITAKGKGTAPVPQGMNGVAFAAVTTQCLDNVNDLTLATLAGPTILKLS